MKTSGTFAFIASMTSLVAFRISRPFRSFWAERVGRRASITFKRKSSPTPSTRKKSGAKSPMIAARMGRDRKRPLREDWEAVKDAIMFEAVMAKFTQHAELREVLLATGDVTIVEHTENDSYWGDGGDGGGRNMLGVILMRVRDELRRDSKRESIKKPRPSVETRKPRSLEVSIGFNRRDRRL